MSSPLSVCTARTKKWIVIQTSQASCTSYLYSACTPIMQSYVPSHATHVAATWPALSYIEEEESVMTRIIFWHCTNRGFARGYEKLALELRLPESLPRVTVDKTRQGNDEAPMSLTRTDSTFQNSRPDTCTPCGYPGTMRCKRTAARPPTTSFNSTESIFCPCSVQYRAPSDLQSSRGTNECSDWPTNGICM